MKIAAHICFAISTLLVASVLFSAIRYFVVVKTHKEETKDIIRQPNFYRLVSFAILGFYGFMVAALFWPEICINSQTDPVAGMMFILFIIPSWWVGLLSFNWKVEIFDDYFVHTNFIGVKHRYTYDEIEIRQYNVCERIFLNGKYRFTISYLQDNCDAIDVARARYFSRKTKVRLDGCFPKKLSKDLSHLKLFIDVYEANVFQQNPTKWTLSNGEALQIPYRLEVYQINDLEGLSNVQNKILWCINSRNRDGYRRQESVEQIFDGTLEEWEIPYIVKLCGEYIEDILYVIYEKLKDCDNAAIAEFCKINKQAVKREYSRMVSLWNERYGYGNNAFKEYVGYKIFREIFHISK